MSTLQNYPELLADIADTVGDVLQSAGVEMEIAADIGLKAAERVRVNYGGQLLYLPRGKKFEMYQRDLEIYRQFDGHNHAELAAEYKISVVRIYQIIKRLREEEIQRRQPDLFKKAGQEAG